ncbi:MAG TPA: hypothetical protein VFV39_10630 [Limnobacter sp.]|nr:hypothetical protein [Limnobacter sp.]
MDAKRFEQLLQMQLNQTRRVAGYAARREIDDIRRSLADQPRRLEHFGFKVYSQNDEDGMLEEIFGRLGIAGGCFVEIGVENGLECNTLYLLHKGWRGLWIDGNPRQKHAIESRFKSLLDNGRLQLHTGFVTAENINPLFEQLGVPQNGLDFLSIDVDGMDIYLLEAMAARPKVVCIEYNSKFPAQLNKRPQYNPNNGWRGTDYMGSSLLALSEAANTRGYTLVGSNVVGINAFFVRSDLAGDLFDDAGNVQALYNPPRYWLCQDHFSAIGHTADFGPYVDLLNP